MPNTAPLRPGQREDSAKPSPVRPALCTHVMPSGATCGSPAVSGTVLCYHHSAIKTAFPPIPFVFPADRAALQLNYFLLLQAFAEGHIQLRVFNSIQRLLRSMDANLGKMPPPMTTPPNNHRSTSMTQICHSDRSEAERRNPQFPMVARPPPPLCPL